LSNSITIDEVALAETIASDPVLLEVIASREAWHSRQTGKQKECNDKIKELQAGMPALRRAAAKANSAIRTTRCTINRLRRTRRFNIRQLQTIKRKETARLRYLKTRAVEDAINEARRQLVKEQKLKATT